MNQLTKEKNINLILLVLATATMLVPFMSSAINLALPHISEDLSLNARMSGWIPTSYMLATVICQIPCAKLADIYGRRKFFILGVFIFSVFSFLCALAYSGELLLLARIFSGVGSAMMFGTSTAILTSSVSPKKRGWALGLITSATYIALAAGPYIGGVLTTHLGWHSIFYVAGSVAIFVALGAILFIKEEWKEEQKTRFDYQGALLYSVGLFGLIYGFSLLPTLTGIIVLAIGIGTIIWFAKNQQNKENPVFNINLFLKNKVFRLSSISALINYAATFAVSFMLSLYLQYVRGLDAQEAGLILIVQAIIQSLVSLVSGRLSDRISPSILATSGMVLTTLGLLALSFITAHTGYSYILSIQVLLGLGFGLFSSPNMNMIMSSVEKADYSMASASAGTMRLTGQSLSMAIAMMAISYTIGSNKLSSQLSAELITSMHMTFIACALLCAIGVYTSSIRLKAFSSIKTKK